LLRENSFTIKLNYMKNKILILMAFFGMFQFTNAQTENEKYSLSINFI